MCTRRVHARRLACHDHELANLRLEPTRQASGAVMSPRHAAQADTLGAMNYRALETELCDALRAAGWIESVQIDRNNDSWIEWTPKGKAYHSNFEASVQEILDYRTEDRRAFLHEFALYHGLVKPTRLESIKRRVHYLIPKTDFLLIICEPNGSSKHYLYTPTVNDKIYEIIDTADAAGNEVLFIEISDLAKAPIPRTTPLGAKGFWGRA